MGAAGKALVVAGCVLFGHVLVALFAWSLYAWAWTSPGSVLLVSAGAWIVGYAAAITPEQCRDTRASAYPFRGGVAVLRVTVVEPPAALPRTVTGQPARERPGPGGGLPDTVPGQVIERDDREGARRADDT